MSLSRFRSKRDSKQRRGLARFSGGLYGELLGTRKVSKDEEEEIRKIYSRMLGLGIDLENPHEKIQAVLRGKYASGDAEKAIDLLLLFEDAADGIVQEITPVKLLGAENNGKVTCYLDSLLFALFAQLDSFEAMLYNIFEDQPRRRLSTMIRLYVNLLRSGKLITADIMQLLQNAIAECGWKEAALQQQQDASEAFTFITETLELPLLTLKMVVAHGGKEVPDDDHRFISERLLNVAIPSRVDGQSIKLETCLDEYFSNRIEVRRTLERRGTLDSQLSIDSMYKMDTTHVEAKELGSDPNTPISPLLTTPTITPSSLLQTPSETRGEGQPNIRKRSATVISSKEHMVQAWCFYSILPFYTETSSSSNASLAQHLASKRPVLGLCLKRYSWSAAGVPIRDGTKVDIPLEIPLPQFVTGDELNSDAPVFGNFKLVLKSAVCHRGNSTQSGHYISLVREDESLSSGSAEGIPEFGKWMRFDDLAKERVVYVDFKKAFAEETPYLLFYQVEPIEPNELGIILGNRPEGSLAHPVHQSTSLPAYSDIAPREFIPAADSPEPKDDSVASLISANLLNVNNELADNSGGLSQSLRQTSRSLFRSPSKKTISKSNSRSRSPPADGGEKGKRSGTLSSLHLLTGRRSSDGPTVEKYERVDKEREKGRKRLSRNIEELFQTYTGSGSKSQNAAAAHNSNASMPLLVNTNPNTPAPSPSFQLPSYTASSNDGQSGLFNPVIEVEELNDLDRNLVENQVRDGGTTYSASIGQKMLTSLSTPSDLIRTSTARDSFSGESSRPGSKGYTIVSKDREGSEAMGSRPGSKEGREREKEGKDKEGCVVS